MQGSEKQNEFSHFARFTAPGNKIAVSASMCRPQTMRHRAADRATG
jgi:hypothetical protein